MDKAWWKQLIGQVLKFATSGAIATAINIGLYLLLVGRGVPPVPSNIIAYSMAVLVNFSLHRRFVFKLKGSVKRAFLLSMLASLIGMGIDTTLVWAFNQVDFLFKRQLLLKLLSTGIVFGYNFLSKRYVFEGELLHEGKP